MILPDEVYREIYKNIFPLKDCIVEAQGRMTIPNFGFRNETTLDYFEHHEVLDCLFTEFSGVCSSGDIIINEILKAIRKNNWRALDNLMMSNSHYYEIIIETRNEWIIKGYPDPHPFWAC